VSDTLVSRVDLSRERDGEREGGWEGGWEGSVGQRERPGETEEDGRREIGQLLGSLGTNLQFDLQPVCVSLFYVIDTGSIGSRTRHHVTGWGLPIYPPP